MSEHAETRATPDPARRTRMFEGFVLGGVLLGVHLSQVVAFLLLVLVAHWDWFVTVFVVWFAGWAVGKFFRLPPIYFAFQGGQAAIGVGAGVLLALA